MSETPLVHCFFNDSVSAAGNRALVTVADLARGYAPAAGATGDIAQVFAAREGNRWRIDSYTATGRPIRFCGHGELAAAYVLFDRDPGADTIRCGNDYHEWVARLVGGDWPLRLEYKKPTVESASVPDDVAEWLGAPVAAAAHSGGDRGYLILELDDPELLVSLQPDAEALASLTSRAVIAACEGAGAADTAFRYFAPQYGVAEDAATGSAAVQLAAWREQRTGRQEFVFHQRSVSGGWLTLRCHSDTVELGGRVAYG